MIHRTFKEPNFNCKVCDAGNEYEWLTYADSEGELRQRLEESDYTVIQINNYDFSKWKDKANDATLEAITEHASGEKSNFKSSIWSELKLHLFDLFHGKCAYCESRVLHVASGDVEHYRPKKKVEEDPSHPGYYWLAYDFNNLLPCCEKCNRARAKMNHFPVKEFRAYRPEDLEREEPLLLNPYKHCPKKHLYFPPGKDDTYFGTVNGTTDVGKTSVKIYNLNRAKLVEERREEQEHVVNALKLAIVSGNREKFFSIWSDLHNGIREFSVATLASARAWWEQWRVP